MALLFTGVAFYFSPGLPSLSKLTAGNRGVLAGANSPIHKTVKMLTGRPTLSSRAGELFIPCPLTSEEQAPASVNHGVIRHGEKDLSYLQGMNQKTKILKCTILIKTKTHFSGRKMQENEYDNWAVWHGGVCLRSAQVFDSWLVCSGFSRHEMLGSADIHAIAVVISIFCV